MAFISFRVTTWAAVHEPVSPRSTTSTASLWRRSSDDRTGFRSGDPELDGLFLRFAGQNQFWHHLGVSCVAVHGGTRSGFVTVAAA